MVSVRQAPVVFPSRACCPLHLPQLVGTVSLAQASLDGGRMTAWNVLFPWVSRPGAGDPSTGLNTALTSRNWPAGAS